MSTLHRDPYRSRPLSVLCRRQGAAEKGEKEKGREDEQHRFTSPTFPSPLRPLPSTGTKRRARIKEGCLTHTGGEKHNTKNIHHKNSAGTGAVARHARRAPPACPGRARAGADRINENRKGKLARLRNISLPGAWIGSQDGGEGAEPRAPDHGRRRPQPVPSTLPLPPAHAPQRAFLHCVYNSSRRHRPLPAPAPRPTKGKGGRRAKSGPPLPTHGRHHHLLLDRRAAGGRGGEETGAPPPPYPPRHAPGRHRGGRKGRSVGRSPRRVAPAAVGRAVAAAVGVGWRGARGVAAVPAAALLHPAPVPATLLMCDVWDGFGLVRAFVR